MNLIFGSDKEAEFFWKEILDKQTLFDYGYSIKKQDKKELPLGGLLQSICCHCGLTMKFNRSILEKLGASAQPFHFEDFVGF
mmetsp:Transcript_3315/g.2868  ORF Transcript_3315/g.2868 Transcript_3315/m.2868 type:complete len:82 (-) Transcript_3315:464-709(-)